MEVLLVSRIPDAKENSYAIGWHLDGCRIGFDAGGSDRKVSAVIDGTPVYSEEVVWYPKVTADPDYHYNEIVSALRTAASHMPRVDGIGISSAGVYVANRTMVASLFRKVPEHLFDSKVKDIFLKAAAEIGDVPVVVCNDGDVTALAAGIDLPEANTPAEKLQIVQKLIEQDDVRAATSYWIRLIKSFGKSTRILQLRYRCPFLMRNQEGSDNR